MSDDWRLHIKLASREAAEALASRLTEPSLEHRLETGFSDRVIVSHDDGGIFLYACERAQAERAAEVVAELLSSKPAETKLTRWHPVAHSWEPADLPLPEDGADLAAEHAQLVASERAESEAQGFPAFEVHVVCAGRGEASELAEQLRGQGRRVTQRWRYLLIGAPDEDSAAELARSIATQLPAGASLAVGASGQEVLSDQPRNPFSFLGGLGG